MIHLLWATIRPSVFIQMHKHWISRSGCPELIKTHVAVNSVFDFDQIDSYLKTILNHQFQIITINSKKRGVCEPSYALSSKLEASDSDIVVFASDDFLPPNNWSIYLIDKLKDKEGALFVNDGYQASDSSNMQYPAITIPIMTFGCLKKLNKIIYNPVYSHMYSDCELYLNLKELNLLIDNRLTDSTVFEHLHHAANKRSADQFDISYHQKWKEDEETWNKRKLMKVEERIKA